MATNRGAWAIGTMVAVGVVLASIAVWFHYQQGRQAMEFWGAPQALVIRQAPRLELLRLAPKSKADPDSADSPESNDSLGSPDSNDSNDSTDSAGASAPSNTLAIDGQSYSIVARRDISTARGLVHARHALIVDASFEWPQLATSPVPDTNLQYAVRFSDDQQTLTVLLDAESRRIRRLDEPRSICLVPKIAAAEQAFFERELARDDSRKPR